MNSNANQRYKLPKKQEVLFTLVSFLLFEVSMLKSISSNLRVNYCVLHLHLSDAFIQSDLQCIQVIHFFCQYMCSETTCECTCEYETTKQTMNQVQEDSLY